MNTRFLFQLLLSRNKVLIFPRFGKECFIK